MYQAHDRFLALIEKLHREFPDVAFAIDETNDYRLFPFESVVRGPSWFQNGTPAPSRLLHNLWNLSPYVPAATLGQHLLGGRQWRDFPVDTLMATALLGHMTLFSDPRQVPDEVIAQAAPWTAFHRAHRDHLGGMVLPLLADPLENGWTALQAWDAGAAHGALLAFRQDAEAAATTVPLRAIPPGRTWRLREAPTGADAGTVTSAQLAEGLRVELPKRGARVLLIDPA
jgi:hypothetical protein